ncbi:DinB family protein [Flaviaesturariibacter terrae]
MKELLLSYARYHAWANDQLLQVMQSMPEEQWTREVPSSFPSLRKTLLHVLDAESIWWQRMQLQEKIVRPSDNFGGDGVAIAQALRKTDQQWLEFVQKAGEHVFTHEFIYADLRKQQQKSMVSNVLLHLFNHGTYHRGQVVTMLRQLGVTTIPATDYILWTRLKK